MRLAELEPRWVGAGGDGVTLNGQPVPERRGVAVSFLCPCGRRDYDNGHTPRVAVHMSPPLDGGAPDTGHTWVRTGDTFETLALRPSIQRVGGCAWHGFVTNGVVETC